MSAEGAPPPPPQEGPPPPQGIPINIQGPNGQQPTPEQIRQIQQQLAAEAEKHGISVQEYVQRLREQAMAQQQAQMRAQQQAQQQQQQQQPIQPGPPKPEALAVADWLKSQELKPRTVVHEEKRKDMFRGEQSLYYELQAQAPANMVQSSEQSAPFNLPPTRKPAQRIPYCLKLPTAHQPRTHSSFSLSRYSLYGSPRSRAMRLDTKATTTARRSTSKASGMSRSSNIKKPTTTTTTFGCTRDRNGSKSYMPWVLCAWSSLSCSSPCGRLCCDRVFGISAWAC